MSAEIETNRRTLMKMGAWSVPVIAVAAATPAAAASTAAETPILTASNLYADYQGETSGRRYGIHFHATITAAGGGQAQEYTGFLKYNDGTVHIGGRETFSSLPYALDITTWLLAGDTKEFFLGISSQRDGILVTTPVIALPEYP